MASIDKTLYRSVDNLRQPSHRSFLRDDLKALKNQHVEMNLAKAHDKCEKLLLNDEKLRDSERYDLKCFAPRQLLRDRETRLEKMRLRAQGIVTTPVLEDPRTAAEKVAEGEMAKIEHLRRKDMTDTLNRCTADGEGYNGLGLSQGKDTKLLVKQYHENLKRKHYKREKSERVSIRKRQ
jgi:hypothetical protein